MSGKKAEKFIRTRAERLIVIDYHNWWCQHFSARDTPVAYIYLTLIPSHSQSALTDWLTHFDENAENAPGVKINRIFCRKAKVQNPINRSLSPPYIHLVLSSPQCRRVVNTPLNLNTHTQHGGESVCMWAVIFHTRPLPSTRIQPRENRRLDLHYSAIMHCMPQYQVVLCGAALSIARKIWVTPWGQIHSPWDDRELLFLWV